MDEAAKRDSELNRLFQRLNFFLIGTAFLIAAFVAVVTSRYFWPIQPIHSLVTLAHSIVAIGFYLALFFTFMNYWNIQDIGFIWRETDGRTVRIRHSPDDYIGIDPIDMMRGMGSEILRILLARARFPGGPLAPHTWMVPSFFAISWAVIWFLVLQYPQWVFSISIPLVPSIWFVMLHSQQWVFSIPVPSVPTICVIVPFGVFGITSGIIRYRHWIRRRRLHEVVHGRRT